MNKRHSDSWNGVSEKHYNPQAKGKSMLESNILILVFGNGENGNLSITTPREFCFLKDKHNLSSSS